MRLFRARFGLLALLASRAWAGSAPVPVGDQFQVNTYTTENQRSPAVAAAGDGSFVVVWESFGSNGDDTDFNSIQGQRYSAGGAPVGGEFQVNNYTTSYQRAPAVSSDVEGNFVVVWHSDGSNGDDSPGYSIQGRRYAASGAPQGGQFQVNSYTTAGQSYASVALDPGGDFVVAWPSAGSIGSDYLGLSAQAQRFSAAGTALGGEFQVNTYTTNSQSLPTVALDADGDFAVVWDSDGALSGDTFSTSIRGQLYSAGGAASGGEFQVNTYGTSSQRHAVVAMAAGGDFVVVWDSFGSAGDDQDSYSIHGQRFSAGGTPAGVEFQVNSYTTNLQNYPAVSSDADGDFVVVWVSNGSDGSDQSGYSIHGQRYLASGIAAGGEFQVNSYTTEHQIRAALAVDPDGDFVAAWQSAGSDGDDTDVNSIQAQRFRVTGDFAGKVFFDADADGLQTGAEPGIPGITVELYDETPALRRTTVTDGAGEYHLRPKEGTWHLRFVAPPAYFSPQNAGGDDTADSDANPATGETGEYPASVNVTDPSIDAGLVVFAIFWDGFESAGFSRWSSAAP